MLADVALVVFFVLVGGVFAAAEIALVSLREGQVRALAQHGRRGERVARLAADPNRFLATVQIGVTVAGFLSAAFGAATIAISAMILVWMLTKKPDLSMIMNGALAGLVAVTAPCAFVDPWAAIVIGIVGGLIVVLGVILLDKLKIDDPVGAVPVHGMNGIWGTISIGLFGKKALALANDGLFYGGGFKQLGIQALGVFSVVVFILVVMGLVFKLTDVTIGLRAHERDELLGLDASEHGMESYAGFQIR